MTSLNYRVEEKRNKCSPVKPLLVLFLKSHTSQSCNSFVCNCMLSDQTSIVSCPGLFKTSCWQPCLYIVALTFIIIVAIIFKFVHCLYGKLSVVQKNCDKCLSVAYVCTYCAPTLWNGLPDNLRLTVDLDTFKTYLFRKCFYSSC